MIDIDMIHVLPHKYVYECWGYRVVLSQLGLKSDEWE